jgi:insertion element IS1 protein InsB
MQSLVDSAAHAARYFSDGFSTYGDLCYWGVHTMIYDKSETYSVEGTNADLRHYLARLGRKSRCFSRCIKALRRAVDLFVHFYNRRQLRKRQHPHYPAHIIDFLPMRL